MAFLATRQQEIGSSLVLTPELPVFELGLLDSVSLIELVSAVEGATGQAVDMLRFDPAAVESIDDLVRELSASLGG